MAWYDQQGRLDDPDPEELNAWIKVPDAIGRVPGGMTPALSTAIYQRLVTRELVAAARIARWEAGQGRFFPHPYTAIDPRWWPNVEGGLGFDHPFWSHGDVKIVVPARGGVQATPVLFCDVSFEPGGLEGLVPGARRMTAFSPRQVPTVINLPEATFQQWPTPNDILRKLTPLWSLQTAQLTIANLLEDGLLRAVAASLTSRHHAPAERVEIPPSAWRGWACLADLPFWEAGVREVFADGPEYRGPPFKAYGIRLDPADVAKHLRLDPLPIAAAAGPPPKPLGTATEVDVRQWYRSTLEIVAPLSEGAVRKLADDYFGSRGLKTPRNALRRVIGEFGHTKSEGKPSSK